MCSGRDSYPTYTCWDGFDRCPSLKTHNLHNTVMEFSVFSACLRWQHSSGSEDDVILKKFNLVNMIKSKTCAMSTKFKMADFLLGLGHCNNWLFYRSACHTHVYQMSLMHGKLVTTAALWGVLAGLLSHPLAKPCTYSPRMTRMQSFMSFCEHLPFEKSYLLELKKERQK